MQLEAVSLSAFLSAMMYPTAIVLLVIGVAAAEDLRYSNEWVVKLEGGNEAADQLALKHGFMNLGQVSVNRFMLTCRLWVSTITLTM